MSDSAQSHQQKAWEYNVLRHKRLQEYITSFKSRPVHLRPESTIAYWEGQLRELEQRCPALKEAL